jgi:hypothetical protein
VPRGSRPTIAEVEFGPTVATSTNVTRLVLRSIRKPLSSVLLSRQASANCDLDKVRAERLPGASVVAQTLERARSLLDLGDAEPGQVAQAAVDCSQNRHRSGSRAGGHLTRP